MIDRGAARGDLAAAVAAAVRGGVDWVQLRERELEGRALLAWAEALAAAARPARVLVNRRVDVALALGADGAHLGFDAMDPATARRLLGERALIGISAHSASELDAPGPVSYAHLAPIFEPISKATTRPALGLAALADAVRRGVPVLAQGGLDPERARAARAAGAAGVAVTGAVLGADDPEAAARALRAALDG